jgi:hypothetical protein
MARPCAKALERGDVLHLDTALDEVDAAARSSTVARGLLGWYNQTVGPGLLEYAQSGDGCATTFWQRRRLWWSWRRGTYECSGVVKDDDDGQLNRGYKTHDCKCCELLLRSCTVFGGRDPLLEDPAF